MKQYHFTGGRPDPESFPVQGLIDAAADILNERGSELTQYPGDKGYIGLREVASSRFEHREGAPLPVDNIAITSGSMQSLSLIMRTFVQPGDTVLTEELCYSGTLGLLRHLKANIVGVMLDEVDGMDMDALEASLKELARRDVKPKLIYTTANHQNPTGAILALPRRKRMVELAKEYGVMIVEDDCYGDIDFEPNITPTAIRLLDDSDSVIFVATFSKILGPGVRLGYFCAPDRFLGQILDNRWDAGTSALSSFIVAEYFKRNLWNHVNKTNAILKSKRDAVIETFEKYLSDVATWTRPRGGLFIWVKLPETTDMKRLQELAGKHNIGYSSGQAFHARSEPLKAIRLAYGSLSVDDIREGITLLSQCILDAQT
ncbi:MAG: PLP-dependent aminotransferase family protein [Candidatus Poribacteria bacterium]